jgi:hypothetical protein
VDQWQWDPRAVRSTRAHIPWRGHSWVCGVLGFKRPRRRVLHIALSTGLLLWCVLCIALIAGRTRFKCEHTLGTDRPKSQLGPTLNDLPPYQYGDLIKHHQFLLTTFSISCAHSRDSFLLSLTTKKSKIEDVFWDPLKEVVGWNFFTKIFIFISIN